MELTVLSILTDIEVDLVHGIDDAQVAYDVALELDDHPQAVAALTFMFNAQRKLASVRAQQRHALSV